MRLRVISARYDKAAAGEPYLATATTTLMPPDAAKNDDADAVAGPDRDAAENGSKDESFFEARPWLDSDSDDDFYSVRGDFTPSRGSTPDHHHQRRTQFSGRLPVVDRSTKSSSLVEKRLRLIDFLREKQHYDDEEDEDDEDSTTDVSSSHMEGSTVVVHAEHLGKPQRNGAAKAKKSSTKPSGCFPNLIWKHGFNMCRSMDKEQKKPK